MRMNECFGPNNRMLRSVQSNCLIVGYKRLGNLSEGFDTSEQIVICFQHPAFLHIDADWVNGIKSHNGSGDQNRILAGYFSI